MNDFGAITNKFQQLIQSLHDKDLHHDIFWTQYGPDPIYFQLKQADLHPQVIKITPSYTDSKGIIRHSIPVSLSFKVYFLQHISPTVQQTFDPG
eukprot:10767550-Ditylum_brightwellii.AAC.1